MLKKKFFYIAAMMAVCFMGCSTPSSTPDSTPEPTNKPSDKIGDIAYFQDGKCFVHSGYDSSYGDPIGVVFEVKNDTAQKIVGLNQWNNQLWASNTAEGSNKKFETSKDDGSENWNIICDNVNDQDGNNLYQAFTCFQDHTAGNQNWYLPAINELKAIAANKEVIKTSIDLLNEKIDPDFDVSLTGHYWSSSQDPDHEGSALFVYLDDNSDGYNGKSSSYYDVLVVSKLQ